MKPYLLSFAAGLLVGVVYSLLNVRSPAPPLVALVGLLGILLGEQLLPIGRELVLGRAVREAWTQAQSAAHLFGHLPGRHKPSNTDGAPRG